MVCVLSVSLLLSDNSCPAFIMSAARLITYMFGFSKAFRYSEQVFLIVCLLGLLNICLNLCLLFILLFFACHRFMYRIHDVQKVVVSQVCYFIFYILKSVFRFLIGLFIQLTVTYLFMLFIYRYFVLLFRRCFYCILYFLLPVSHI